MNKTKPLAMLVVILTLTTLVGGTLTANAQVITHGDRKAHTDASAMSPTNRKIMTLGDRWWNWALGIDTSKVGNPFTDTSGEFCDLGKQKGNLLFLVGTAGEFTQGGVTGGHTGDVRTCNTPIPRGTNLFFPLFNTECSELESLEFPCAPLPACQIAPVEEEQLRACAIDLVNHVDVDSLKVTIDGVPSNHLVQRVQSGPGGFQLTVVPNNPFITALDSPLNVDEPTTTPSVSDGYWVLLKATGLRPGAHTISFGAVAEFPEFDFEFRTEVTYNLVVK